MAFSNASLWLRLALLLNTLALLIFHMAFFTRGWGQEASYVYCNDRRCSDDW